jgi:hypothetical protein
VYGRGLRCNLTLEAELVRLSVWADATQVHDTAARRTEVVVLTGLAMPYLEHCVEAVSTKWTNVVS